MKCLSVRYPWVGLQVANKRLVEVRKWKPTTKMIEMGKPFLLHASTNVDKSDCERLNEIPGEKGAIIGYSHLESIEQVSAERWKELEEEHMMGNIERPYGERTFVWHLISSHEFPEPIPFKGQLGFFNVPDKIVPSDVIAELNKSRNK